MYAYTRTIQINVKSWHINSYHAHADDAYSTNHFCQFSSSDCLPLTNGCGNCITSTPTCTAAFNSTIIMAPAVIPDLLSGYWGYSWPEILGAHSNGHDAAIAVIKGAMKIINSQDSHQQEQSHCRRSEGGERGGEREREQSLMNCPCLNLSFSYKMASS